MSGSRVLSFFSYVNPDSYRVSVDHRLVHEHAVGLADRRRLEVVAVVLSGIRLVDRLLGVRHEDSEQRCPELDSMYGRYVM